MTLVLQEPPPANGNGEQHQQQLAQHVDARRRDIRIVQDSGPLANLMDTARFEHMQRIAGVMGFSSLVPDHLRGRKCQGQWEDYPLDVVKANCFRIVDQALRWGFDPFAIIDETYMVGGKLGYQGKLVAAVVNARAGLKGRLNYSFDGAGENRTVTVFGTFDGEDEPRTVSLRLGDAKTDNQMWRKDPDQKLIYSGVVKWARRYCPEVVLGVLTDDDLERMAAVAETAPAASKADSVADRLARSKAAQPAIVPHPTDEQRSIDTSTSNEPPSDDGSSVTPREVPPTAPAAATAGQAEASGTQGDAGLEAEAWVDSMRERHGQLGGTDETFAKTLAKCAKLTVKSAKVADLSPEQRKTIRDGMEKREGFWRYLDTAPSK